MKRFIAVVCVFLIAVSMSNAAVYADITFGVCGLSATWDFYEDTGKLVISGKGELYGYESCAKTQSFRNTPRKIRRARICPPVSTRNTL